MKYKIEEKLVRKLDLKYLQKVLEDNIYVDSIINDMGATALHVAASLPREKDALMIAKLLLSYAANPNQQDRNGCTSIHYAASMGYQELIMLLLANGGDILLCDKLSLTAIDCAHSKKHYDIVDNFNCLLNTENCADPKKPHPNLKMHFWRQLLIPARELSSLPASDSEEESFYSCFSKHSQMLDSDSEISIYTYDNVCNRRLKSISEKTGEDFLDREIEHLRKWLDEKLPYHQESGHPPVLVSRLPLDQNFQSIAHCVDLDTSVDHPWNMMLDDSIVAVVDEFIYEDTDKDVVLVERRCPTSLSLLSLSRAGSICSSTASTLKSQKSGGSCTNLFSDLNKSSDSISSITGSIRRLGASELRQKLLEFGCIAGPIVTSTWRVYQRHLLRLRKNPIDLENIERKDSPTYSRELHKALRGLESINWSHHAELEVIMMEPFTNADPLRHWRDGVAKHCFNYLLLDPRVTSDLPIRAAMMSDTEKFHCFLSAIFYIGKGTKGRPYSHLYEALQSIQKKPPSSKVERIRSIWNEGHGVISLQVFHDTIPVEAWTREASMIASIGLENVTNTIRGTFYGPASTWNVVDRRRLGTYLLWRASQIFLLEGERQLRPGDMPQAPNYFKKK